jgi:hypothetical protein
MTPRQIAPRGKYAKDPMVPLLPERLRAAMDEGGWTLASLSARMGKDEHRQTLHHLMWSEMPVRCRHSRRQRLARILEVPARWLEGGDLDLPFTGIARLNDAWPQSPRFALAAARLMGRCVKACKRDLKQYEPKPGGGSPWTAADEVLFFVASAVAQFGTPAQWQRTLLQRSGARPFTAHEREWITTGKPLGIEALERWPEAEEQAALGLVRALAFVLTPWIDGRATLDYGKLRDLLLAISPRSGVVAPDSTPPDAIVTKDGRRLRPDDPSTPFSLIEWPSPSPSSKGRK